MWTRTAVAAATRLLIIDDFELDRPSAAEAKVIQQLRNGASRQPHGTTLAADALSVRDGRLTKYFMQLYIGVRVHVWQRF